MASSNGLVISRAGSSSAHTSPANNSVQFKNGSAPTSPTMGIPQFIPYGGPSVHDALAGQPRVVGRVLSVRVKTFSWDTPEVNRVIDKARQVAAASLQPGVELIPMPVSDIQIDVDFVSLEGGDAVARTPSPQGAVKRFDDTAAQTVHAAAAESTSCVKRNKNTLLSCMCLAISALVTALVLINK